MTCFPNPSPGLSTFLFSPSITLYTAFSDKFTSAFFCTRTPPCVLIQSARREESCLLIAQKHLFFYLLSFIFYHPRFCPINNQQGNLQIPTPHRPSHRRKTCPVLPHHIELVQFPLFNYRIQTDPFSSKK
jgi:hypothetical protein